jgi:hypothetical protein
MLELLEEHAVLGDLSERLPVGGAGHASPIGNDAPCRGRRITRTSWQKYFPPNCAPTPVDCVIFSVHVLSSTTSSADLGESLDVAIYALAAVRVAVERRLVE